MAEESMKVQFTKNSEEYEVELPEGVTKTRIGFCKREPDVKDEYMVQPVGHSKAEPNQADHIVERRNIYHQKGIREAESQQIYPLQKQQPGHFNDLATGVRVAIGIGAMLRAKVCNEAHLRRPTRDIKVNKCDKEMLKYSEYDDVYAQADDKQTNVSVNETEIEDDNRIHSVMEDEFNNQDRMHSANTAESDDKDRMHSANTAESDDKDRIHSANTAESGDKDRMHSANTAESGDKDRMHSTNTKDPETDGKDTNFNSDAGVNDQEKMNSKSDTATNEQARMNSDRKAEANDQDRMKSGSGADSNDQDRMNSDSKAETNEQAIHIEDKDKELMSSTQDAKPEGKAMNSNTETETDDDTSIISTRDAEAKGKERVRNSANGAEVDEDKYRIDFKSMPSDKEAEANDKARMNSDSNAGVNDQDMMKSDGDAETNERDRMSSDSDADSIDQDRMSSDSNTDTNDQDRKMLHLNKDRNLAFGGCFQSEPGRNPGNACGSVQTEPSKNLGKAYGLFQTEPSRNPGHLFHGPFQTEPNRHLGNAVDEYFQTQPDKYPEHGKDMMKSDRVAVADAHGMIHFDRESEASDNDATDNSNDADADDKESINSTKDANYEERTNSVTYGEDRPGVLENIFDIQLITSDINAAISPRPSSLGKLKSPKSKVPKSNANRMRKSRTTLLMEMRQEHGKRSKPSEKRMDLSRTVGAQPQDRNPGTASHGPFQTEPGRNPKNVFAPFQTQSGRNPGNAVAPFQTQPGRNHGNASQRHFQTQPDCHRYEQSTNTCQQPSGCVEGEKKSVPGQCTHCVGYLLETSGSNTDKEELCHCLNPEVFHPVNKGTLLALLLDLAPSLRPWQGEKLMMQKASFSNETCVHNVFRQLKTEAKTIGHVVEYFTREDSRRMDIVKILLRIHPECQYCHYVTWDLV